jgi:AGZA family xanthine/uracil permease-like MFS transporter
LQKLQYAYYPALMIVGVMMFGAARHLDTQDLTELIPALVTIVMMVFTYNIANGLTAGLILHPVLKVVVGRWREVHPGSALLGGVCLLYYVFGELH